MVGGIIKSRPLNAKSKELLKKLSEEVRELSVQRAALSKQIHQRNCVIDWLESPWDYGDIVEELPRPGRRNKMSKPRVFVVVDVGSFRCKGRLIKQDGTLGKDAFELFHSYKDKPIGRYTGKDLPEPPTGAEEAMKTKGTW